MDFKEHNSVSNNTMMAAISLEKIRVFENYTTNSIDSQDFNTGLLTSVTVP